MAPQNLLVSIWMEGPPLLNGHLATVAMDLEGLELPPLVVVDGDPFSNRPCPFAQRQKWHLG
jgi:hypothetical protein